jgi:hypothetical protein
LVVERRTATAPGADFTASDFCTLLLFQTRFGSNTEAKRVRDARVLGVECCVVLSPRVDFYVRGWC